MDTSLRIVATRLSNPDQSGYLDKCRIIDQSNGMELWHTDRFSTNPNPSKPNTTLRWTACYAQIICGVYPWKCIDSPKHGKCIALCNLGMCETTLPNMNPDTLRVGKNEAYDVEIHCGFSQTWRGSMACQTVYPDDWPAFISHFTLGQTGLYELINGITA